MKYKALLFDFDGVIARTFDHHLNAWQQVLSFTPDGMTIKMNEGKPGWQIAQALFEQVGQSISEEQGRYWIAEKNKIFSANKKVKTFTEISDILQLAKKSKFQCGLVTGTTLGNVKSVLDPKVIEQFDVIITDTDTERGKPHPDPYLAAVKKMDLTPETCIVVENAPLGVESAKKAGAFCIALETTLTGEQLHNADVILNNHQALKEHIIRLIGTD